jgi:hypothetical protein
VTPAEVALARIQRAQDYRPVAAARRRVVLFHRKDSGLALARIIARNMVDDLLRDMFARLEAGRSVSPSWLRGRLALARYQRVTFVDLFQAWAWATQAALAAR